MKRTESRQCQRCGAVHWAVGAWDRAGAWHLEDDIHSLNSTDGFDLFGEFPRMVHAVVAQKSALCQRCQNPLPASVRARQAARSRVKNWQAARGQVALL